MSKWMGVGDVLDPDSERHLQVRHHSQWPACDSELNGEPEARGQNNIWSIWK